MSGCPDSTVSLVVTSPPYPMIAMWDACFSAQDSRIKRFLNQENGTEAYEAMHQVLDSVWKECFRVLMPGGFLCINIGDATRSIGGGFRLYTNHSRIQRYCESLGLESLPTILWRKPTNAPNKFMGSGMLPAGAYVTLEHEYILVLRKGGKRVFADETARNARRESGYFWEERNVWFSDIWDLKGVGQSLGTGGDGVLRERSGAFPFELAYRVINMYSLRGDTVLDPFLGTGTTTAASVAAGRSSLGYEADSVLSSTIRDVVMRAADNANRIITDRLTRHRRFVRERQNAGTEVKHKNAAYGFPVVTAQENRVWFPYLSRFVPPDEESPESDWVFIAEYDDLPRIDPPGSTPELFPDRV
jgi:modification methylase